MSLYSITGAQLAFGHVALLDHADFSLEAGERVGLIGRNGAGKSSLLKIVADLAKPDDGLVTRQQELVTVYVPQEPEFEPGATVRNCSVWPHGIFRTCMRSALYSAKLTFASMWRSR